MVSSADLAPFLERKKRGGPNIGDWGIGASDDSESVNGEILFSSLWYCIDALVLMYEVGWFSCDL
jgi:hypothetical protein